MPVLDDRGFCHVNGQFAEVRYVVANPLEVFGDKHQSRVARGRGRLLGHLFD